MTPEEARAVDAAEFAADCARARVNVLAAVAERRSAERARLRDWLKDKPPVKHRYGYGWNARRADAPGVGSDFPDNSATGAPSNAQDFSQLEISE